MPQFKDHPSAQFVKILAMAPSGTGKTGMLAALLNEGYKLAIYDFDNGLDVIKSYIRPEFIDNLYYITLQDQLEIRSVKSAAAADGSGKPGDILSFNRLRPPTAYPQALKMLNRWREPATRTLQLDGTVIETEAVDLGKPQEFGPDWFVVIDSATTMGEAALLYTLAVNDHDVKFQSDYGEAMDRQEKLTELLCCSQFKTNVLINCHVHQVGSEKEAASGGGELGWKYPSYLGAKLPPKVAKHFNTVITLHSKPNGEREIITSGVSQMSLKSSAPKALERRYTLEVDKEGYATNGLAAVVKSIKQAMEVK